MTHRPSEQPSYLADNAYDIRTVSELAIHPNAEMYYDRTDVDTEIAAAVERCYEWDYEADKHGYCHERSTYYVLLQEIERLRAEVAAHAEIAALRTRSN